LGDVVRRLPERVREPVVLHYYADLSVDEVAEVLRRPAGTVKRQLSEARDLLAQMLREEDG
jgi:RNA polymerase sigma-70 factor (ECF subfamily)